MQRIKRIFLFLLTLMMVACVFAGCDQAEKIAALKGPWYTVRSANAEATEALLLQINLYEPELALIEDTELRYCQSVEFLADQTYTFRCDTAVSQPFFRDFFYNVFLQLYERRAALSELYRRNFSDMSQDAFFQFYAELYRQEDFNALLDDFAQNATFSGGEILSSGTFTLRGNQIVYTDATGVAQAMHYQLDEAGTLLLTYSNGSEPYTHEIPTP